MKKLILAIIFLLPVAFGFADLFEVGEGKEYPDLESAVARAMRGDTIVVYAGEYISDDTMTIFSKHWLDIVAFEGATLICTDPAKPVIEVIRSDNIEIEGFRFEHRTENSCGSFNALVSNCYYINLHDNEFEYCDTGVKIYDGRFITLSNNTIANHSSYALRIGGLYSNVLISNNQFVNNSGMAFLDDSIEIKDQSTYIEGLSFYDNQIIEGTPEDSPELSTEDIIEAAIEDELIVDEDIQEPCEEAVPSQATNDMRDKYNNLPFEPRYGVAVYQYERYGFLLSDELNRANGFLNDHYLMDEPDIDIFADIGSIEANDVSADEYEGLEWRIDIPTLSRRLR